MTPVSDSTLLGTVSSATSATSSSSEKPAQTPVYPQEKAPIILEDDEPVKSLEPKKAVEAE
jgi:hypothetical protein